MTSASDDDPVHTNTPETSSPRRLLLMRHAKAAYPDHCSDHQRPLAGRGRKDSPMVGEWLSEVGWVPDLVICSDAARTVETAQLVIDGLGLAVPLRPDRELYEAGVGEVLMAIAGTTAKVGTLLVVGHEPTMSASAATISGKFAHFPTATIAQIELESPWQDIEPGAGRLVGVRTPKD